MKRGLQSALWEYLPVKQHGLVWRAFILADSTHAGQWRESGEPYINHPLAVATVLAKLRLDGYMLAAGLLHDVIEDTAVTCCQIERCFGREVARLVDGVTFKTTAIAAKEANWELHKQKKLAYAIIRDPRVGVLRLADRLDNMRTLAALSRSRQVRLARETVTLYVPLAHQYNLFDIRDELQQLALDYLPAEEGYQLTLTRTPAGQAHTPAPDFGRLRDSILWKERVLSLFLFS